MIYLYSIAIIFFIVILPLLLYRQTNNRHLFFPLLLPLYSAIWQTTSVLVVEYGFYITEQKTYSYFTGGALRTYLCHAIFFGTYTVLCSRTKIIIPSINTSYFSKKTSKLIITWVSICLLLIFINISLSPSPLLNNNITRFNYLANSVMPWIKNITSERFFYAFSLLGACYAYFKINNPKKTKNAKIILILLLISLFLVGEKFTAPVLGGLIFIIYSLSSNSLVKNKLKTRIKKRHILATCAALISIFIYVYYMYSSKYELGTYFGSPLLAVLYRGFVLQGHTQWGLDALYNNDTSGNMKMWLTNAFSGMNIAMNAIAPPEVLEAFSKVDNASFSSAYPGVALYTGGWLLVISAQAALAIAYFYFSILFIKSIASGHILISILSMQAMFTLFYIYNMGNFNEILSGKFILSISLIALIKLSKLSTR